METRTVEHESTKKPKPYLSSLNYESLLQRKERKHPYNNRIESHAEMMQQCHRARMKKVLYECFCRYAVNMVLQK